MGPRMNLDGAGLRYRGEAPFLQWAQNRLPMIVTTTKYLPQSGRFEGQRLNRSSKLALRNGKVWGSANAPSSACVFLFCAHLYLKSITMFHKRNSGNCGSVLHISVE